MSDDYTIRQLQEKQREWAVNTFEHTLLHAVKAVGKLAGAVDDMDHAVATQPEQVYEESAKAARAHNYPRDTEKFIADLVICAIKLAKEIPTGEFDLQALVVSRMREKGTL